MFSNIFSGGGVLLLLLIFQEFVWATDISHPIFHSELFSELEVNQTKQKDLSTLKISPHPPASKVSPESKVPI